MSQWVVVRFPTFILALTWMAGCGSPTSAPRVPPPAPAPAIAEVPPAPPVDAAIDAPPPPPPPKLVCEDADTAPAPAPAPEPTWWCARADGTRHGPFVTLFPDGAIEIRGAYKDGVLDGAWERHDPETGGVVEQGRYAAGKKHGRWTQLDPHGAVLGSYDLVAGTGIEKRWYADGPLYRATARVGGVRHGRDEVYTHDGVLIEVARYRGGKLDGARAFGTRGTMRFEETFARGVLRGRRKIWSRSVLVADETYDRRGRRDGRYASWRSTRLKRVEGTYAAGKRTGRWVWHDRYGKPDREGSYVAGKRDGAWREWWDDKLVWSGHYTAGRPDGAFVYYRRDGSELGRSELADGTGWMMTFHRNGKPASKQHLSKGRADGRYVELTSDGKLLVDGRYARGVKHGTWKEQTERGVPVLEQHWKRGQLDGVVKKYVDGKPSLEARYTGGLPDGPYVEYRDGKPAVVGQFDKGGKTGTWTWYDAGGAVVRIATYKDGVLDGPYRETAGKAVIEGQLVAGRRDGTWTTTEAGGEVRTSTYGAP